MIRPQFALNFFYYSTFFSIDKVLLQKMFHVEQIKKTQTLCPRLRLEGREALPHTPLGDKIPQTPQI
jgi:hypothetical protein